MINSPSALGAKSNGSSTQFMQEVKLRLYLKNMQDLKMRIEGYSILRRVFDEPDHKVVCFNDREETDPIAAGESQIP